MTIILARSIVELGEFINSLLNVETLSIISIVGGIIWKLFKSLRKILEKQQDDMLNEMHDRVDKLEVEILRLQILEGMDSERLSKSELLYFYDKYQKLGGNSFVEQKVEDYIENLEMEMKDNASKRT